MIEEIDPSYLVGYLEGTKGVEGMTLQGLEGTKRGLRE